MAALHFALQAGYEAGLGVDPAEPQYPVIVYLELGNGVQASWHMPLHQRPWNGHTTQQKYQDIGSLISDTEPDGQRRTRLEHSGVTVEHSRYQATDLALRPHPRAHGALARTARLVLDQIPVGWIITQPDGADTILDTDPSDAADFDRYVAAARYAGQPMTSGQVLDALLFEHTTSRDIGQLVTGECIVRQVNQLGHPLTQFTVSRTQLATELRRRAVPGGGVWKTWTPHGWDLANPDRLER